MGQSILISFQGIGIYVKDGETLESIQKGKTNPGCQKLGQYYWNWAPQKPSSLTEFMINLSIPDSIPFLVPSDLSSTLTEHINQSQVIKTAVADNIVEMMKLLL